MTPEEHLLDNLKYQIKMARLEQGQALRALSEDGEVSTRGVRARDHIQRSQDYLNGRMDR